MKYPRSLCLKLLTIGVYYDESNRKVFFSELFKSVDLQQLSCTFLEEKVVSNNFVTDSKNCSNAVLVVFSKKFIEFSEKMLELQDIEEFSDWNLAAEKEKA